MKLHADHPEAHSITAYGDGWITVNGQRHEQSLVIGATSGVAPWACQRFEDLEAAHFDQLLAHAPEAPELVLLGSGRRLRFVHPRLLQGLLGRRIGVETMDTAAACRTFNILAGEGRRVLAALLVEP